MKKLLSIILAIVMTITVVPLSVFAYEGELSEPPAQEEYQQTDDDNLQNDFPERINIFDTVSGMIEDFMLKFFIEPALMLPTFFIMSVLAVYTIIVTAFE